MGLASGPQGKLPHAGGRRGFQVGLGTLSEKAVEALGNETGMLPLGQSQNSLQDHLLAEHLAFMVELQLVGDGEKKQVGRGHAVNGGHKGHGHPGAQTGGFGNVLHETAPRIPMVGA